MKYLPNRRYRSEFSRIAPLKMALTATVVGALAGCSSAPVQEAEEVAPMRAVSEIVREDVTYPVDVYDPLEGFNRSVYNFNARFDQYIFLPAVTAYETVTPDLLEQGVTNFFENIDDVGTAINNLLQLKFTDAIEDIGRVAFNSTIGLGGLIDIASGLGMEKHNEDFGQTLGHYGVGDGPYLVLPIFGPSNARDTTGLIVDTAVSALLFDATDALENASSEDGIKAGIALLNAIDARHTQDFRYYQTGSPFEYDLIRMLYGQQRQFEIAR